MEAQAGAQYSTDAAHALGGPQASPPARPTAPAYTAGAPRQMRAASATPTPPTTATSAPARKCAARFPTAIVANACTWLHTAYDSMPLTPRPLRSSAMVGFLRGLRLQSCQRLPEGPPRPCSRTRNSERPHQAHSYTPARARRFYRGRMRAVEQDSPNWCDTTAPAYRGGPAHSG